MSMVYNFYMNNIDSFTNNKFVVIRNAVSRDICDLVAQYTIFSSKTKSGRDHQVPGAYSEYADSLMESLLLALQPTVEKNTGLSVFPTYSYYRVYYPGDKLDKHTDRESCEISLTLCLGYDYIEKEEPWEIWIGGESVSLEPGDLVCYRGIDLEHWRDTFKAGPGSWHSQVFLHYVDVNGPYAEYKYDKRYSIGDLKRISDS